MHRKLLLALAPLAALFQAAAPVQAQPAFEVASIRPSEPITAQGVTAGVRIDGAQVRYALLSLRDYVRMAYKVKDYQIDGPDWMASARFDIVAKIPSGGTPEQVPEMLGSLLAERFQMKMHRTSKDFAVYGLVAGKSGPKLKASPPDAPVEGADTGKGSVNVTAAASNTGTVIDLGKGSSVSISYANNRIEGKKVTMAGFADLLARFTDRPVVDMTQIQGVYDLTLDFSPEDFRAMMIRAAVIAGAALPPEALKLLDAAPGDSLFNALDTIGLKLEPRKAPLEVLVIDRMEKAPSDN
jgi:uncharacterized protein (TIGR03435 family)